MRFLITPAPHPTECISGYLHSLTAANGYERPTCIVKHLKRGGKLVHLRLVDPPVLQEIAGLDMRTAQRLCFQPENPKNRRQMKLLDLDLHVSEARMDVFRICPQCVQETGRHDAAWHLWFMEWCPTHRTRLLEVCEQCHMVLGWNRPAVGKCKCGADLTVQGGPDRCSEAMASLLGAIRAALYKAPEIQQVPSSLSYLGHLDLYGLSRFIHILCEQLLERGKYGNRIGEPLTLANVAVVADILHDWPHNFRAFLKKAYEPKILADRFGDAFRHEFDWAFTKLRKNLRRRGEQFEFLIDEIYRFGAQYIPRERLVRGAKGREPVSCQWGSVLDAAELTGMDPRALLKRIRIGEIPVLQSEFYGARSVLVDLEWIRKWKVSRYASIPQDVAAELLGLSRPLFVALRKSGVFRTVYHTARMNGCSEEDVEIYGRILHWLAQHHSDDGSVERICWNGVGLRAATGVKQRVEMLDALIAKYPDLWEKMDVHALSTGTKVALHIGSNCYATYGSLENLPGYIWSYRRRRAGAKQKHHESLQIKESCQV